MWHNNNNKEKSTSNSINVTLSVPSNTELINRHADGEIEIHEICQFHVNGFRLTLNIERKRRNWKHIREFNANSHVVGKNKHAMRHILSCSTQYWEYHWKWIWWKIVRASNQQKLSHFLCLTLVCMKNWLCDKKSLLLFPTSIFSRQQSNLCVVSPFFLFFLFLFHLSWTSKFLSSTNFIELQKNILCKKIEEWEGKWK